MQIRNVVLSGAALLVLSACGGQGSGFGGEYGQSHAGEWFTVLEFEGADKVTLTMIGDSDRHSGTYTRDGDNIAVTAVGETRTLKVDANGCLDGDAGNSFFTGVVCKKP